MHRIHEEDNHYVIEIIGRANLEVVTDAIRDSFSRPDYFLKNDIYIFSSEFFDVQIKDLELLTQFILENLQVTSHRKKSALVVPAGFNMAVAEVWAGESDHLPYELKLFSELKAAQDWVADSSS